MNWDYLPVLHQFQPRSIWKVSFKQSKSRDVNCINRQECHFMLDQFYIANMDLAGNEAEDTVDSFVFNQLGDSQVVNILS